MSMLNIEMFDEMEEEQPTTKRRSSILKIPKSRNPFEEIDESFTESTKPIRRVSFASSNFIKPFVADPEKNTIWDTTYEEDVNHTNSTQSSQEQIVSASTKIGSFFDPKVSFNGTVSVTHFSVNQMEITTGVDKENIPLTPLPAKKLSIVDYAKKLSMNSMVPLFDVSKSMELTCQNIQPFTVKQSCQEVMDISIVKEAEKTILEDNMEFTCQLPVNNELSKSLGGMELTYCQIPIEMTKLSQDLSSAEILKEEVPKNRLPVSKILSRTDNEMGKRQNSKVNNSLRLDKFSDSQILISKCSDVEKVLKPTWQSCVEDKLETDMEFTCQISEKSDLDTDMEFTCQIPKMSNLRTDMDSVCQIPTEMAELSKNGLPVSEILSRVDNKMETSYQNSKANTLTLDDHMEFSDSQSCIPKIANVGNPLKPTCQSRPEDKSETDMEFTCQISKKSDLDTDMEFTCQIPKMSNLRTDNDSACQIPTEMAELSKTGLPVSEILSRGDNKMEKSCQNFKANTLTSDSHMEFSDSQTFIPKIANVGNPLKRTTCQSYPEDKSETGMEFTCQISKKSDLDSDMEFTCQIPKMSNLRTDNDSACQIPTEILELSKTGLPISEILSRSDNKMEKSCQNSKANTLTMDSHMEFSDSQTFIPKIAKKGNPLKPTCQSCPEDKSETDMEFTCQISKKSDLDTEMEFTCQIPKMSNLRTDNNFACKIPTKMADVSKTGLPVSEILSRGDNNMEFSDSQTFSSKITNLENVLKPTCQSYPEDKSKTDMEFTCQISKKSDTCQIPESDNLHKSEMEINDVSMKTVSHCGSFQHETIKWESHETSKPDKVEKSIFHDTSQIPEVSNIRTDLQRFDTEVKIDNSPLNKEAYDNKKTNITQFYESFQEKNVRISKDTISKMPGKTFFVSETPTKTAPNQTRRPLKGSELSQIPIRVKTPERLPVKEESKLNFSCTTPSEEVKPVKSLFSQRIPIPEFSVIKTPEQSFNLNLTSMSSGVDHTQYLLHCTYSKANPASFLVSRIDDKNDSVTMNFENSGHVSRPNLTNNVSDFQFHRDTENSFADRNSADVSMVDVVRSKLTAVNDTYVLKNKVAKSDLEEINSNGAIEDKDDSLGIIPVETFNWSPVKEMEMSNSEKLIWSPVKKFDLKIRRASEVSHLMEKLKKQREHIKEYLDNLQFRPLNVVEMAAEDKINDTYSDADSDESGEEIVQHVPTVEEKIREKQESSRNCWKLESGTGDSYHFSTLFGTLLFQVVLDSTTVVSVLTSSRLTAKSKPIARYIMRLFLNKLNENHIKAAIGANYDILTLLDYVQMTMLRLNKFQVEFVTSDWVKMEEDFVAKFRIFSLPLILSCDILVDVGDVENLKHDEDIKIIANTGVVNEDDIKRLAKKCPKGLDFFKSFQDELLGYVKTKEHNRKRE